jgi:hypothetical protein
MNNLTKRNVLSSESRSSFQFSVFSFQKVECVYYSLFVINYSLPTMPSRAKRLNLLKRKQQPLIGK